MDRIIEFFGNIQNAIFAVSTIGIIIIIAIVIIVGVFKELAKKNNVKFKIGSVEFSNEHAVTEAGEKNEIDGNSEENKTSNQSEKILSKNNFLNILPSIIEYSITEGYNGAQFRRELYDSQMDFIRNKYETIRTNILHSYMKQGGKSYNTVEVILKHAFEPIIGNLKHVCIKDRLNEKTLQAILEINKNIIEVAVNHARNLLINPLQPIEDKDLLLKCFDEQSLIIQQGVEDCITYAYNQTTSYLKDLQTSHEKFHKKIYELLVPYCNEETELKMDWDISLPPNRIVGEI